MTIQKLIEANQQALLSYALALFKGNKDDAKDLVQDTNYKLLKVCKMEMFEAIPTKFKHYALTSMRHIFINIYRKRKQGVIYDGKPAHLLMALTQVEKTNGESLLIEKELKKVIDKLHPRWKESLNLFSIGYRYIEIAEKLKIPLGTVKSRIHLGRKQLLKIMKYA